MVKQTYSDKYNEIPFASIAGVKKYEQATCIYLRGLTGSFDLTGEAKSVFESEYGEWKIQQQQIAAASLDSLLATANSLKLMIEEMQQRAGKIQQEQKSADIVIVARSYELAQEIVRNSIDVSQDTNGFDFVFYWSDKNNDIHIIKI
jgi:hypothetical protein